MRYKWLQSRAIFSVHVRVSAWNVDDIIQKNPYRKWHNLPLEIDKTIVNLAEFKYLFQTNQKLYKDECQHFLSKLKKKNDFLINLFALFDTSNFLFILRKFKNKVNIETVICNFNIFNSLTLHTGLLFQIITVWHQMTLLSAYTLGISINT